MANGVWRCKLEAMLIFIDETGDHDLINIDPQYPLFALGALVISEKEYEKMDAEMKSIKKEFFDDDGTFILHSSELRRPLSDKSDDRNTVMVDPNKRAAFYKAFDTRITVPIKFGIIACFIRKRSMADTYVFPADPYYFSFENLLNRIIRYGNEHNVIHAETRGPELDTELLSEYEQLSKTGIHSYSPEEITAKTSLKLVNKKDNMNGLQAIDLMLLCLARKGLGKELKMIDNDLSPQLVESKYLCPPTIFPYRRKR